MTNKDAALALASQGIHVFPCNPDKTPRIHNWEQAATSSPFAIGVKWDGAPDSLPGLPVGAHGLVVIDADRKPNGPDGVAAFTALCADSGIDVSNFFVVESPSNGLHFYFRTTDVQYSNSRGSLPAGIDVRGVGGYVIAPGATLPDGRSYRHVAGAWGAIPALPEPLAALLREKRPASVPEPSVSALRPDATDREREYARAALQAEIAKLRQMGEGSGRNAALNSAAHSLATMDGWIDLNEVASALFDASVANGYVAKDGERAAKDTIASGINAGRQKPREPLPVLLPAPQRKAQEPIDSGLLVIQGSQIQARPISWLWDGYLPVGKLTLLAGAGGTGKSTIAFNLAATVTRAGIWPDGTRCAVAGNVLIWSSEDDPADTIKPRLMAVGADESRYGIISGVLDKAGARLPFDAGRDMGKLRAFASHIGGVALLIIDPIVTAVTGDMHKANDVRHSLQSIVDFAAEMNCAVVGITHFAKGTAGKNSAERVIGSQAFAALARMVLVAAKDEESNERVFTRAKSNNSVDTGGFSYAIEPVELAPGMIAPRVVWGNALEGSSRLILANVEGDGKDDGDKLRAAKQYLIETISQGFVPAKELMKHASEGYGIKEITLRRAFAALSGQVRRVGFGKGSTSMWGLPSANLLP